MDINEGDQSLSIVLECDLPYRLCKNINKEYIDGEDDFFRNVFEEPHDILDYLILCFNEIKIVDNRLVFNYEYGGIKKKAKMISIELLKE